MVSGLLNDPVWLTASSLGLSLLFALAGWHKWRDRAGFVAVLHNYAVLPERLVAAFAVLLPGFELVLAAGLLLPSLRLPAALLAAALLLGYAAVMALTLLQGRRIADCGCEVGVQRQAVSAALVWRNLLLALLALNLLQAPSGREPGLFDWLVTGAVLLCGCVFYLLANTLIANQHSARELSL